MLLLWIPAQSMARRPSSCRPKGRQSAQHCTGRPSSWSMSMALEEVRVGARALGRRRRRSANGLRSNRSGGRGVLA